MRVKRSSQVLIHGTVAPGFEAVEDAFRQNFDQHGEIGAACAAYHHGQKVVDLWGGYRDLHSRAPWEEDTLVWVYAAAKGMAAMTLALCHARGWLDYEERVAAYWPEFAQAGKSEITVRQLLAHQAGLPAIDAPLGPAEIADPDLLAAAVAAQRPAWQPGTHHGYHALSLGWYEGELVRRVDPQGRTLGRVFQEEIAGPLGVEFYFSLPEGLPDSRLASMKHFTAFEMWLQRDRSLDRFLRASREPESITSRTLGNPILPAPAEYARSEFARLELPSANGAGTARGLAHAYSVLIAGDTGIGIGVETISALAAPPVMPSLDSRDQVLRIYTAYALGFSRPSLDFRFGSNSRAFGAVGSGGAFAFGDPDAGLAFAYTPNRMRFGFLKDPRHVSLCQALYRCAKTVHDRI